MAPGIDLEDEVLRDFIAEVDDYYQLVLDGIGQMRRGEVGPGVEAVLRPVHTIKGTAGFIPGLEPLKTFAHRVEDGLKELQGAGGGAAPGTVDTLAAAVDEIFNLIEQVKSGAEALDDGRARVLMERLEGPEEAPAAQAGPRPWFPAARRESADPGADGPAVQVLRGPGTPVLKICEKRLHLPSQYEPVLRAVEREDGGPMVLDLTGVRTISSTAWGELWRVAEGRRLAVTGMGPAVLATYFSWGLTDRIPFLAATEDPAAWPEEES